MKSIDFSVTIYPSMSRPQMHAISITGPEGSMVLGLVKDVEKAKEALSEVIAGSDWTYDENLRVHTMEVSQPL